MGLRVKINLIVFLVLFAVLGAAFSIIAAIERGKLISSAEETVDRLIETIQIDAERFLNQIEIQKQFLRSVAEKAGELEGVKEIKIYNSSFKIITSKEDKIGILADAKKQERLQKLAQNRQSIVEVSEAESGYLYEGLFPVFLDLAEVEPSQAGYIEILVLSRSKSQPDKEFADNILFSTTQYLAESLRSFEFSNKNQKDHFSALSAKIGRFEAVSSVFIFDENLEIVGSSGNESKISPQSGASVDFKKQILDGRLAEAYYSEVVDGEEISAKIMPIFTNRMSSDLKSVVGKKIGGLVEIQTSKSFLSTKIDALINELAISALVLMIVLSVILFYFLNKEVITPVAELSAAAEKVSGGDFWQKVAVKSKDELGRLSYSFNAMVKNIEELDKAKSEFISIASHQLRTPLSAIKWSLKMLSNGDFGALSEEQKEIINNSYQSNEKLISLVHDLLDVSRIEEKRIRYEFKKGDLIAVAKDVLKDFYRLAEIKNIKLFFSAPNNVPQIKFDDEKIRMVFQNLLDNAVKYTPEGGKISLSFEKTSKEVMFSVKDSGMGIPKDQIGNLFKKFFRARNVVGQTEGTGLGLFIVESIIDAHKGKIWAESEEGKGTVFYVTLPISG